MDIFSISTEKSIRAIFNELEGFRIQSGFTVSYEKTTLYRIGSLRHSDAQLYSMDEFVWSNKDIKVLGVTIAHEDIVEKNYSDIISKAEQTLKAWYNRGLSLIGKVQVINTLVASLFVYHMMVLPKIPQQVVRKMNNIFREFLWNGRKAKVSLEILQNPKNQGGLNLVNLTKKDVALKTTWPKILNQEEDYAKMVYGIMRCSKLEHDIWRCNLKQEDVQKLKIHSHFWEDVLESWGQYNYYNNKRIENQIIWYNSQVCIEGKPFFWADTHQRGLKYIYQLFKQKQFKSHQQVYQEYGLTKLRYNSLITALPKEWKDFFQQTSEMEYMPLPPHNYDQIIVGITKNTSRKVYKFLADDVMLLHNKYMKWRQDLGSDFCQGLYDYGLIHLDVYKLTNVPKYRSFQYRLLQRAIVTNINMHRWGMISSPMCTFCGKEEETETHLFFSCQKVQELWVKIVQYTEQQYHLSWTNFTPTGVILNQIVQPKTNITNFVCLITKQFIYRQRCQKGALHFPILKGLIRKIENIEKYIAIKNNRISYHVKKWRC